MGIGLGLLAAGSHVRMGAPAGIEPGLKAASGAGMVRIGVVGAWGGREVRVQCGYGYGQE